MLAKLPFVLSQHTIHVPGGQTNCRTDGFAIGKTALHTMQRGKTVYGILSIGQIHVPSIERISSKCKLLHCLIQMVLNNVALQYLSLSFFANVHFQILGYTSSLLVF